MNDTNAGSRMPLALLAKLEAVRRRARRTSLAAAGLRSLAILLLVMALAMAIDAVSGIHESAARWGLTGSALAVGLAAITWFCLWPLRRGRSLADVARLVDQAHPSLEERFETLTEFSGTQESAEFRGSESLRRKVAEQAVDLGGGIQPGSVISVESIRRSARFLGVVGLVLALWFALDFGRVKVLCARFWLPGSNFSLTRLASRNGDLVVGSGDPVTIEIAQQGRIKEMARLDLRYSKKGAEVVDLARAEAPATSFIHTLGEAQESFDYRATAGDGQTAWHHVEVRDRPRITQARLRVLPPAYTHLPTVDEASLPAEVRVLEGSRVELSFKVDQPSSQLRLKLPEGKELVLPESSPGSHEFQTALTNNLVFAVALTNQYNLGALNAPTCDLLVYHDEPPTVRLSAATNEISVRANDKLSVEFEAQDDFGLSRAALEVTIKDETNTVTQVIPIPLTKAEIGAKFITKQVELDLAQFHLKQGQELSYVVRVTDTKENPNEGKSLATAGAAPGSDEKKSMAENQSSRPGEPAKSEAPGNPQGKPDQANQAATAPKEESQPADGTPQPANSMTTRQLDVAQSSTCKPMRVVVDEWGRSFEGQAREKQELAIDPVLKHLRELLGEAKSGTEALQSEGKAHEGLDEKQAPKLESIHGRLREADQAVTELKTKSADTPYAFIGLQVHDVRESHLTPARQELGAVTLEVDKGGEDVAHLGQASGQIQLALQKLEGLTKSYDAVKRDYKVADAMERLKKMHQIFLEDSEAMLGSKKPVLNPQDRKMAEVSDDFAEKYNQLLEEKKKIMAELAKVLADDPRMLRRFLAMEELDGTSLRDQLTLLAQRQQTNSSQLAQWLQVGQTNRGDFIKGTVFLAAREQVEIGELLSKMQENLVTWLPLEISPDTEQVVKCRELASAAAAHVSKSTVLDSPDRIKSSVDSARQSLDQLRDLHAHLPALELIPEAKGKLAIFEANRFAEVEELITRQSGWIKKMEAVQSGDFVPAAEVDQHRLSVDTATLANKLEVSAASVSRLSPEIAAKSEELKHTMKESIMPEQSGAMAALASQNTREAAVREAASSAAFAQAEAQYDALLKMIIAKLDEAPPPTDPGANQSLEDMLAMLQEEKKAAEGLGVPCRPINVSVMKDWQKPGSGSTPAEAKDRDKAQARAAQQESRKASEKLARAGEKAKELAKIKAEEMARLTGEGRSIGPQRPAKSWNTIVSKLGDDVRQGRDNVPPEQYRQAIEDYFNAISERPSVVVPPPQP